MLWCGVVAPVVVAPIVFVPRQLYIPVGICVTEITCRKCFGLFGILASVVLLCCCAAVLLRCFCPVSVHDGVDVFRQSVLNILSGSDDKKITRINKVCRLGMERGTAWCETARSLFILTLVIQAPVDCGITRL